MAPLSPVTTRNRRAPACWRCRHAAPTVPLLLKGAVAMASPAASSPEMHQVSRNLMDRTLFNRKSGNHGAMEQAMLSVADLKESELRTVQESDEARCTVRTANPAYSQVSGTCPWCRYVDSQGPRSPIKPYGII